MDDEQKAVRILYMYKSALEGQGLNKRELSITFNVSEKTIQRDIDVLREFLARYDQQAMLLYHKPTDVYKYVKANDWRQGQR